MENKDIDYFCIIEVIKVINKHHIKYTEDFLKNYPKPVHLKKKRVDDIITGQANDYALDFLFEDYLTKYCKKLAFTQLLIKQEISSIASYEFTLRVKQPESRLSKLLTYRFEKAEEGKLPVNKCLNDLFGCRIILEFNNINDAYDILKQKLKDYDFIKLNKKDSQGYKAIHIYFEGSNKKYFPWELQIWHKDNELSNKESHANHKQSYLKWPELMKR
ncbi:MULTISPECIES: hypothetical protein [Staphylococcus]|uniref:hypothetical protein n=1 Tax=Staphylococcus TaxID=1279 RepID=UPI000D1D8E6B|nr:hypothetical protein [Staphylococcus saprophyticus]PTJ64918.1 hypothetical protein BUZ77_11865 [Staphylococcus saprophyticus]